MYDTLPKMYHTFQVLIAQSSWLYPTCVCIEPLPNSVLSSRKRPAEIAIISGIRYAEVNCKKLQDGCASDWGTRIMSPNAQIKAEKKTTSL